ncbi:hypothetical protein KQI88_10585 [Alkaliphilus sp. MSJ-5]|uniref:Uncharacterized protein n=1 Tax=Alkaliphilus flagellatus TaxID=2841507 RepID=A0ABS6G3W5_9FIRM|nr:hypothetical protein [Alkaliphilus flagellatus]MBU5676864.1 hypothetical protein [Alkaliphilus flagellatus]
MNTIVVYPHKGIGNILFGMTRKEVEQILLPIHYKEEPGRNGILVRYDNYHITYKDNIVFEICINNLNGYKVVFNNIDLFHTKAEDIFNSLRRLSDYDCDCEDEYLSCTYYFKDLGMILWRESAFHPKLLQEGWFQKLISVQEENLEYEQRFWFFNQICLKNSMASDEPMKKAKFYVESTKASQAMKTPTQEELKEIALKYGL